MSLSTNLDRIIRIPPCDSGRISIHWAAPHFWQVVELDYMSLIWVGMDVIVLGMIAIAKQDTTPSNPMSTAVMNATFHGCKRSVDVRCLRLKRK